jgi:hypothetical protein
MLEKMALVLLMVTAATGYMVGSGSNLEQFTTPLSLNGPSQVITANFFGFTTGKPDNPEDYPPESFPIGATGHSSTFAWWAIERKGRGQYDFSFYDRLMNTAAAHGKTKWITFTWVPAWAEADTSSCGKSGAGGGGNPSDACTDPPTNNFYFTEFVQAVVDHYNGFTAPCVEFYELWNEAQSPFYWSGTAAELAAMVQPAVAIIHASPCHSKVIGPSVTGPLTVAQSWMAEFLDAGGSTMGLDGVSYHGYMGPNGCSPWPAPEQALSCGSNSTFGSAVSRIQSFRAFYDAHGMAGKLMFMSEGGPWSKQSNLSDPDLQSAYAARYLTLQASQYGSQGLRQTYWFAWGYSPTDDNRPWDRITDADGNPNAAGVAIAEIQKWLIGSYFLADCSTSGSIYSCSIVESDSTPALIVWDTAKTCSNGTCATGTYGLPVPYTRMRDITGVSTILNSAGTIQLGAKPVFLDFH